MCKTNHSVDLVSQFQLYTSHHTSSDEYHVKNLEVEHYLLLAGLWVEKTLASVHDLLFRVNKLRLIYQTWSSCHTRRISYCHKVCSLKTFILPIQNWT